MLAEPVAGFSSSREFCQLFGAEGHVTAAERLLPEANDEALASKLRSAVHEDREFVVHWMWDLLGLSEICMSISKPVFQAKPSDEKKQA